MPSLDVTKTSEALAISGGYVIVVGLVSFFIKEKLFVGESPSGSGSTLFASKIFST